MQQNEKQLIFGGLTFRGSEVSAVASPVESNVSVQKYMERLHTVLFLIIHENNDMLLFHKINSNKLCNSQLNVWYER